jgi:hypothetical protein
VERSGTLIETDEEVRQAISGLKGQGQPESLPAAIRSHQEITWTYTLL